MGVNGAFEMSVFHNDQFVVRSSIVILYIKTVNQSTNQPTNQTRCTRIIFIFGRCSWNATDSAENIEKSLHSAHHRQPHAKQLNNVCSSVKFRFDLRRQFCMWVWINVAAKAKAKIHLMQYSHKWVNEEEKKRQKKKCIFSLSNV